MLTDTLEWSTEQLPKLHSVNALLRETTSFLNRAGVHKIALYRRGIIERTAFTNYPDAWISQYRKNDLEKLDPVVQRATATGRPTIWSTAYRDDHSGFNERARAAGMPDNGITLSLSKRPTHSILFSICGDIPSDEVECSEMGLTVSVELLARRFWFRLSEIEQQADTVRLTPRETQSLHWAACGKSAWETATILGLCEGTVSQYLHSAARKLNADSKTHALALAVDAEIL